MAMQHIWSGLCLALIGVIVLTSQAFATARGHANPGGTIVNCEGHVAVTVQFDADGNPIEVPYLCPDATLMLADGLPSPNVVIVPTLLDVASGPAPVLEVFPEFRRTYATRGPPQSAVMHFG